MVRVPDDDAQNERRISEAKNGKAKMRPFMMFGHLRSDFGLFHLRPITRAEMDAGHQQMPADFKSAHDAPEVCSLCAG
jgi:hypothetical protein